MSPKLTNLTVYIMQQQAINTTKASFFRQNGPNRSITISSSPLHSQYQKPIVPLPHKLQFSPNSDHCIHAPPSQSFISKPQSANGNPNRQLKLDSYAREVSQQQETKFTQNAKFQHMQINSEINLEEQKNFFNQYAATQNGRFPMYASTLINNNHGFSPHHFQKQERMVPKNPSHINPAIQPQQPHSPQLTLNLTKVQDYSTRQNKTDRDRSNKPPPFSHTSKKTIGKFPSYDELKQQIIQKKGKLEHDSTVNSSIIGKPSLIGYSGQRRASREINNIMKPNDSPPDIELFSISIREEKGQNILYQQFDVSQPQKRENNSQDKSNNDFKKKGDFSFFKTLKRRYSNAMPGEQNFSSRHLQQKKFEIDNFQLIQKIGKGSFGDVYVAQQKKTGFLCVIKKLQKKKLIELKLQQHLMRQIKIQSYLNHKHLVSLYGFFSDKAYIYLILELMSDGSLMQVKKKKIIPELQVSYYIRQICLGLKYMHTENAIHRDIKPENIFLNDGYAKIGDFGCSVFTLMMRKTQIGSFAYISPQQLKMQSYDEKIDVWSVGIMTYEMLVGGSPFESDIIKIAKKEIPRELPQLKFPSNVELSPQSRDFLIHMLDLDPTKRFGINEALRHEFILKYLKEDASNQKQNNFLQPPTFLQPQHFLHP